MANEAVKKFLLTRNALKDMERDTKEQRTSQRQAERTLGGMLSESMQRNNVDCLSLPPADDGKLRYVRLVRPARRVCVMRTEEDVLALVNDVSRHVTDVAAEDLPKAVVALVVSRARERGASPPPPRIRVCDRPARQSTESAHAPTETRRLSTEFTMAHRERHTSQAPLKRLRSEHRSAEKILMPILEKADNTTLQIEMRRSPDATPRTLKIARRESAPTSDPEKKPPLGIRHVTRVVRLATLDVAQRVRREDLDVALSDAVLKRLRDENTPRRVARVRIAVSTPSSDAAH